MQSWQGSTNFFEVEQWKAHVAQVSSALPALRIPREVGLLVGGWGFEREENLHAGASTSETLRRAGHNVVAIDLDSPESLRQLHEHPFRDCRFAFLCITEELPIQFILDAIGIRYTGSSGGIAAAYYDKWVAQQILRSHGVLVPHTHLVPTRSDTPPNGFEFPAIVKPRSAGASAGMHVVRGPAEWSVSVEAIRVLDRWALAQEFLIGEEFTTFFLDDEILGCIRVGSAQSVWSHGEKARNERRFEYCLERSILAIHAPIGSCAFLSGVRGLSRIDTRVVDGKAFVLDVNTSPYIGAGPGSSTATVCDLSGLTHYGLLQLMYRSAHSER